MTLERMARRGTGRARGQRVRYRARLPERGNPAPRGAAERSTRDAGPVRRPHRAWSQARHRVTMDCAATSAWVRSPWPQCAWRRFRCGRDPWPQDRPSPAVAHVPAGGPGTPRTRCRGEARVVTRSARTGQAGTKLPGTKRTGTKLAAAGRGGAALTSARPTKTDRTGLGSTGLGSTVLGSTGLGGPGTGPAPVPPAGRALARGRRFGVS
jgi:hypothetical protein